MKRYIIGINKTHILFFEILLKLFDLNILLIKFDPFDIELFVELLIFVLLVNELLLLISCFEVDKN